MEEQEIQAEVERRMQEQRLEAINKGAVLISIGIKILSQRVLVFFSVMCILFLFSWVMAAPDVLRVVAATLASIAIWFVAKVDMKDIRNEQELEQ